jgi:nitroreductase
MGDLNNETLRIIKQRRSIRNFRETQVSDEALAVVIQAGLYAPTGGGNLLDDIHFTVVQDRETLFEIDACAMEFARESDSEWLKKLGSDRHYHCLYNAPTFILISYKEKSFCAEVDCAAATENMLLAAESIGLGACWLFLPLQAFYPPQGEMLKRQLNIPAPFQAYSSLILGYKKDEAISPVAERKPKNILYIR